MEGGVCARILLQPRQARAHRLTHSLHSPQVYLGLASVVPARSVSSSPPSLPAQQPTCCHGQPDSCSHRTPLRTYRTPMDPVLRAPTAGYPTPVHTHRTRLLEDEWTPFIHPPPYRDSDGQSSTLAPQLRTALNLPIWVWYMFSHVQCICLCMWDSKSPSRSWAPAIARYLYSPCPRGYFFYLLSSQVEP